MAATNWKLIEAMVRRAGATLTKDAGQFILTLASGMTIVMDEDAIADRFLMTTGGAR